jgi:Family of unknown function (DUF5995)
MSAPLDLAPPTSVREVIERFDTVLGWARQHESRLGYFAALYRGVTLRARTALSAGAFENPDGAEQLVIFFASRYFESLAAYLGGAPTTHSWQVTFAAASRWMPTVSQHLLLGINAHINLDLGVATARTLAQTPLPRADFDRVNGLLLQMIDEVEAKLAAVWPLLRLLDRLAGRLDERLIGAGLLRKRAAAWDFAQALRANEAEGNALIERQDLRVAEIARHIVHPGPLLRSALSVVRLGELRTVVSIIDLLTAQTGRPLSSVNVTAARRTPPAQG